MSEQTETASKNEELRWEIDALNVTCGTLAAIEFKEDRFVVKSTLEDKGEIKGGQKVGMEVGLRQVIPITQESLELEDWRELTGLRVITLVVNGEELVENEQIFLCPVPIFDDGQKGLMVEMNVADPWKKLVILSSMKNGGDLLILFHEKGHLEDPLITNPEYAEAHTRLDEIAARYYDKKSHLFGGKMFAKDPRVWPLLKLVIQREQFANKSAVERVGLLSKENVNLFPEDPNLQACTRFLENKTREIVDDYGEDFVQAIGSERIAALSMKLAHL